MANPGYVRSTDGSDADNGSTWALANSTLAGAMADQSAGDTIYVSQSHAETAGGAITLPGTLAAPNNVICANDAVEPPTAVATTAAITCASAVTVAGSGYVYGITLISGNGSGSNGVYTTLSSANQNSQVYDTCSLQSRGTHATGVGIVLGPAVNSSGLNSYVEWRNCTLRFGSTGSGIIVQSCEFVWRGGGVASGGTSPTSAGIIKQIAPHGNAFIEAVDFSLLSASTPLVAGSLDGNGKIVFRNCKLPSSWSGGIGVPGNPGLRIEMWNCSASDTNYAIWIQEYAGSIKDETTLVRTGGASDGTTTLSWNMTTTANAEFPGIVLSSPEIASAFNTTVGSSLTATVEILHDSATALKDDEVWLEVNYLGTSGVPLGTIGTDVKATFLTTAADQTTSSETWTTTGMANPNKQKLAVTFTPQEQGVALARVCVAKASYTLYVDPKVTIA